MTATAANGAHIGFCTPPVVIFVAATAGILFFLRYTTLGRSLYAVGGNPLVAGAPHGNERGGDRGLRRLLRRWPTALAVIAGLVSAVSDPALSPIRRRWSASSSTSLAAAVRLGAAAITGAAEAA